MYTIYTLIEDGREARRARITERLGLAGPTVSQTVGRLERDGLLTSDSRGQLLALTTEGHRAAVAVTRKHRLAERMLKNILGVSLQHVHSEAIRWQRVLSEESEKRIADLIDDPTESPWGNPIPGLEELGIPLIARAPGTRLGDIKRPKRALPAIVRSISEETQGDSAATAQLITAGILPGAIIRITFQDDTYTIQGNQNITIPAYRAHAIRIDTLPDK